MKVQVLKKALSFPSITPKFKGKLDRELEIHKEKIELIEQVLQKPVEEKTEEAPVSQESKPDTEESIKKVEAQKQAIKDEEKSAK